MGRYRIHIKTKENYRVLEIELYNVKDRIISSNDDYLKSTINSIEQLDSKFINKCVNDINKRIRSFIEIDHKFLFRMYKEIYGLRTKTSINKFIEVLREENNTWIIKSKVNDNLRKINKALKENGKKPIVDLSKSIDIEKIDKALESKGELTLTKMIEKFKEKDFFNEIIDDNKDLFLAIFINKILSFYYENKINKYSKEELYEMIKKISNKDNSCIDEIFKSLDEETNKNFKDYCGKIISDAIYSAYSKSLKNKCWNEKCCNANKCNRITSCDMDIRNYSYITDGIMFIDEKNHIERSIVIDCNRFKKSNYVAKDVIKERLNPSPKTNEETRSEMRYRLANMTSPSKGLRFTENMYTELTEEDKLNMSSMKQREELRNIEKKALIEEKNRLLNSKNTLESDKPKTKKMINNNLKKLD